MIWVRATRDQRLKVLEALRKLKAGELDVWVTIGSIHRENGWTDGPMRVRLELIDECDDLCGGAYLYSFTGSYEADTLGRRKDSGPLRGRRYVRDKAVRAKIVEYYDRMPDHVTKFVAGKIIEPKVKG